MVFSSLVEIGTRCGVGRMTTPFRLTDDSSLGGAGHGWISRISNFCPALVGGGLVTILLAERVRAAMVPASLPRGTLVVVAV